MLNKLHKEILIHIYFKTDANLYFLMFMQLLEQSVTLQHNCLIAVLTTYILFKTAERRVRNVRRYTQICSYTGNRKTRCYQELIQLQINRCFVKKRKTISIKAIKIM